MSRFDEAFARLLDANDRACGKPQFILVNGRKRRAIIEETTTDEIVMAGGQSDKGGGRAMVAKKGFADEPEQGDPVDVRGKAFELLSLTSANESTYTILFGELAAEDA